jgi:hypothetical protein
MSNSTASGRFPLKVSEPLIRIVASEVFVLAAAAAITASPWFALILAADFALRSLVNPAWSPLRLIAKEAVLSFAKAGDRAVFYSPKRFAALIGFSLSLLALIGSTFGSAALATGGAGILALFSFLEAAFGFCAGCKIYGFLMRQGIIPTEWCPECVNL